MNVTVITDTMCTQSQWLGYVICNNQLRDQKVVPFVHIQYCNSSVCGMCVYVVNKLR